jgi:large subunit ribosomal protein L15
MITLSNLSNTSRPYKKVQRIGRGPGSNRGKTCGRGNKGDKARQGYKQRYGEEGGQKALFRRLPIRGFNHGMFVKDHLEVTFEMINRHYHDGEVVNQDTLCQKGLFSKNEIKTLKVLATGTLTKKVSIEAHAYSKEAEKQLQELSLQFKRV